MQYTLIHERRDIRKQKFPTIVCQSKVAHVRTRLFIIDMDRFTRFEHTYISRRFALRSFVCSLKCSRARFLQRYILWHGTLTVTKTEFKKEERSNLFFSNSNS